MHHKNLQRSSTAFDGNPRKIHTGKNTLFFLPGKQTSESHFQRAMAAASDQGAMPLFAKIPCAKKGCGRPAYYAVNNSPRCGYCANKHTAGRKKLKKDPNSTEKEEEALLVHQATIENARDATRDVASRVNLFKLKGIIPKIPQEAGYITVLPNKANRSGLERSDGALNMSSLSPRCIGPVEHGQPDVPPALSIECFHQGSKYFSEMGSMEQFRETQRVIFADPSAPRHNPFAKLNGKNRNIPEFFVWIDHRTGVEHHLGYVESRQFYCNFLERAIIDKPDMHKLRCLLAEGYQLLICEHDAHSPAGRTIEEIYLDPSRPFGHGFVIYTMLVYPPEQWPWRKHKTFEF
jgi:hypothetical protein